MKINRTIRNDFAGHSTGSAFNGIRSDYYPTKGHAINRFDGYLQEYDLGFDRDDPTLCNGFGGDNGRATLTIVDEFKAVVGYAVLSWYRMPSGNYEFTGYIA